MSIEAVKPPHRDCRVAGDALAAPPPRWRATRSTDCKAACVTWCLGGNTPLRAALLLLLAGLGSGCVTVYQPQLSLQRPVVIDTEVGNFDGLKMLLRCVPGEYQDEFEARKLCNNLRPLFVNQGAQVKVEVPAKRGLPREDKDARPDLIVDLNARLLHEESSPIYWFFSLATFTLLPAIHDFTFAQDIVVRDTNGFVLATDSLQGRFVRYFGLGSLLFIWIPDLIYRARSEKLSGTSQQEEFSRDFHGQLSQIVFHARMRSMVMHSFEVEPPAPGIK